MIWIFIAVIAIVTILLVAVILLYKIEQGIHNTTLSSEDLLEKIDSIQSEVKKRGSVSDPFKVANSRRTQNTSSRHIIIRKSPDQIRSENYEKIKEGQNYGDNN